MLSSIFNFPKPKSEETFEDIVCDLYSREFKNPNLQRYGRSGQGQDGVDILGVAIAGSNFATNEIVAIQCKNHIKPVANNKLAEEVCKELETFEAKSEWKINKYIFATSADNSKPLHDFVIKLNKERLAQGKFAIEIVFWEYITNKLDSYPDLLYKYFTKYLPTSQAEKIEIPDLRANNKKTLHYKASEFLDANNNSSHLKKIKENIKMSMGDLSQTVPYNLYLGFRSGKNVNFDKQVDISIDFQDYYIDSQNLDGKYRKIVESLKNIISIISDSFFSKDLVIYLDTEISLALFLGRALRRNGIDARVVFKDQVWSTKKNEAPFVDPELIAEMPATAEGGDEQHVAYYFNAAGKVDRKKYMFKNIEAWSVKPQNILMANLNGFKVVNSSHAYSTARQVVNTIHNIEGWEIKHIHLFLVVPKALALLIGHLLNTLTSTIHIYFLDEDRERYLEMGTMSNKTF